MTNNENQQALKISINETTQKILMPNLFALITTIMSYSIIGLTSSFNSISIYCSFICKLTQKIIFNFKFKNNLLKLKRCVCF